MVPLFQPQYTAYKRSSTNIHRMDLTSVHQISIVLQAPEDTKVMEQHTPCPGTQGWVNWGGGEDAFRKDAALKDLEEHASKISESR